MKLISEAYFGELFFQRAVEAMQKYVLEAQGTRLELSPEDALICFRAALQYAADNSPDFVAVNFEPEEIRRQRVAIRKAWKKMGL
jgi:hypothetical protein